MELGTLVAEALFASAKGTEIFSGLGRDVVIEVEVDTASLVCDEVRNDSARVKAAGSEDLVQLHKVGHQCCLTFDFRGWFRVGTKDGSLPGDIEEDFDGHVC